MITGSKFVKSNDFHLDYKEIIIDHQEPLVHYHDKIELALFLQADIRIYVKDRLYEIRDGDMMLLAPYDVHRIEYKHDTPYTRYVINVSPGFLADVLNATGHGDILGPFLSGQRAAIRFAGADELKALNAIFSVMWQMLHSVHDSPERTSLFKLHTASLLLLFMQLPEKVSRRPASAKEEKMNLVLHYLNEHYLESFTLDALADRFYLNKFYLAHAFKAIVGMTVTDYVQFKRVEEAKRLLKTTDKSVLEVSLDCGYENVQHFHRVFKKLAHLTPYQFKRLT
ncbi:AraC family transcriptional regulator [Paenibacillus sp. GCM10023248]|uniref:AraC family transcriptional regulator n=1 Tax=unclassified Paenibacillus TaxID=185978 RepID=UPI002379BCDE|nr:AraC family transcriptional regulator [Paenibacillus sp. MAHUQ-63]MDD9268215.1 AraC family transcriptional regulator [Paenibacillus sp. MAHUQ-63]